MQKFKKALLIISSLFVGVTSYGQLASSLVINEVQTNNVSGLVNKNGEKATWFEIYNPTASPVNIAGCYLTNDSTNLKKYLIAKGNKETKIEPHQRLLFFCNSATENGVTYTNFSLVDSSSNYIAIVSANGLDIIDEVRVPALKEDVSWGCIYDGDKEMRATLAAVSPNALNYIDSQSSSEEKFKLNDPYGIGMALTAMSVVFTALLCLFISFKIIGKISTMITNARSRKAAGVPKGTKVNSDTPSGEVYAAIAMALAMHEDAVHDFEDTILTMKKVEKRYSPWSSKVYNLRETPKKH